MKHQENITQYYNINAKSYIKETINIDMSENFDKFMGILPSNGAILDVGSGSGRDLKRFSERKRFATGIDISQELVNAAQEYSGCQVRLKSVLDLNEDSAYAGIWCCASLLHLTNDEFIKALKVMYIALEDNGVILISVKKGDKETIDALGRYMNYYQEDFIKKEAVKVGLEEIDFWETPHAIASRNESIITFIFKKNII